MTHAHLDHCGYLPRLVRRSGCSRSRMRRSPSVDGGRGGPGW
ncbi:hypothetical protein ACWGI8_09975 [Streptomyces sp. NPDC054841]